MSDDHSPGDGRQPYSDRGGAQAKHAETHDVRREELTNPKGPAPVDESFAEHMAPDDSAGRPGGHVDESIAAADDKALRNHLPELDAEELARLAVLEKGVRLDQGGAYLDLNDLGRGPFKAIGGQEVGPGNRYVAKRDTDFELWNRLAGDRDAAVERPSGVDGQRVSGQ
jgi:hypothetical protein